MPLWDPFLDAIQAMSRCGRAGPHALDNVTLGEWITFHTFMAALGQELRHLENRESVH